MLMVYLSFNVSSLAVDVSVLIIMVLNQFLLGSEVDGYYYYIKVNVLF